MPGKPKTLFGFKCVFKSEIPPLPSWEEMQVELERNPIVSMEIGIEDPETKSLMDVIHYKDGSTSYLFSAENWAYSIEYYCGDKRATFTIRAV